MPSEHFTSKDVDDFDLAIVTACLLKSEHRIEELHRGMPYSSFALPDRFRCRGYLVVSFDAGWYPFLDNTRSKNPPELRWYVPPTKLLSIVAAAMQLRMEAATAINGGRVFLDDIGAVRRENGKDVPLLYWSLPKKSLFLESQRLSPEKVNEIQNSSTRRSS